MGSASLPPKIEGHQPIAIVVVFVESEGWLVSSADLWNQAWVSHKSRPRAWPTLDLCDHLQKTLLVFQSHHHQYDERESLYEGYNYTYKLIYTLMLLFNENCDKRICRLSNPSQISDLNRCY